MNSEFRLSSPIEIDWSILAQVAEQLTHLESISEQGLLIKNTAEKILNCRASIWFAEASHPFQGVSLDLPDQSLLTQSVARTKNPVFSSRHGTRRIIKDWNKALKMEMPKAVAFPLIFRDSFFGAFEITRLDGKEFTSDELKFAKGLAIQAAISLQASAQSIQDQRQLDMLSLVRTVSAQIVNILDVDELASRVTRLILDTFHYYFVAIFSVEHGKSVLEFRDSAPQFTGWVPSFSIPLGEGIIGHVALHGTEVLANDVSKIGIYRELTVLPETRSEVALPLKFKDKILGVLDIQSDRLNAFQSMDMIVLRSLADHIATALENARLYSDLRKRVDQLKSISEVSNAIASILDEDELLSKVVGLLHKRMSYPEALIYDVHPGRGKIFFRAGESANGPILDQPILDLQDQRNLISWVARNGQVKIIDNLSLENQEDQEKHGSAIIIPISFSNDVLGVLYIEGGQPGMFGGDDEFLLGALSDNIAIAMRNAYLYRSEQWRRKVAESMREIAGMLAANTDLRQVLQSILKELEGSLPIDISAIWLLEPGEQAAESGQYLSLHSPLRLSAVRLSDEFIQNPQNSENSYTPEEIIASCNESILPSPWLQRALNDKSPSTRTNDDPYEPLGAILDFPEYYSAIAVPLMIGDNPMGLLTLAHHTSGRYGHEAKNMAATYASYAAVAIENTQLYEAAHDQAWVSTVLLQVAEATQSLNSLDELLNTMVQTTPTVIGISSCSIFLWDNSTESFNPTVTFGLKPEQENLFKELQIALGEIEFFDHVYFKKSPALISQNTIGERDTYISAIFGTFLDPDHSAVLFPMMTHGDVLGAFLVTYDFEHQDTLNGLATTIDWNERFSLVQGIAHQTAVAVENIQLLKAQREEAYVSVALLQVAQSVVSLNKIEEIIESIVRLMPILIGVKRCAVILWDSQSGYYKLIDSFGISRSELDGIGREFVEHEFPFLDSVREKNQMAYHLSQDNTEQPVSWPSISNEEIQIAPPQDKEFLRSKGRLLMGFPLSVKGMVLGVMLTQEGEFNDSANLYQAREKRHEITIGVTQQASLAIQNSMLQKEAVVRERLEREFQLAREIQQTFLPDKMPELDGWVVGGSWHPARQVSGDFYDLIPFPNGKLGLVIADVADKGMPAALFMTLIRTLIRASARGSDSPATVLRQVNELLLPDAKHGMFVTVVYALINLQTGSVTYANAGHNPPIISRSGRRRHEILPRTGMALGVLEDMRLDDQKKRLAPGDCLILYTDGITESFSPEGEMFGETRLRKVIKKSNGTDVKSLIDAIENSVDIFIGGQDYSDDLTLLVLHRRQEEKLKNGSLPYKIH